jgi:3-phosphoshikimate 1-carboxyvinyltransferase
MQRACAAALLVNGRSVIRNPGHSNDDLAAMDIISRMGAKIIKLADGSISVESRFLADPQHIVSASDEINCGESGLSVRMFTPLAALCENRITIKGEGSLLVRPLDFFDQVLPGLGVQIQSDGGKLPVSIKGPVRPSNIEIDGSLSSQFLTGLLMAFASSPYLFQDGNEVSISVSDLKSRPYIDLTLQVMETFGLRVPDNHGYKRFTFHSDIVPAEKDAGEIDYTVEGDWSGGAFLLVAGALAGNIRVRGLSLASTQADRKIVDALMAAGAGIAMEAKGIVMHAAPMTAFEFDATDCPDLFPPLVALAARCEGVTKIKGVSRLRYKESNRGVTLQEEFGKMGLEIRLNGDVMEVYGGSPLRGTEVHSRFDHRIAMACAVAGLKAEGNTTIVEAQAINKSYPDFYEHLKSLGAGVTGWIDMQQLVTSYREQESRD